jgi:RND family efflux transporter MFP subunit
MTDEDLSKLRIEKGRFNSRRGRIRKPGRIVIAALGVVFLVFVYRSFLNPVTEVSVATVSLTYPSQAFTQLNASGYVVAQRKAAVASKATGRLEWLGVEEGSKVKRGEVIARLENRDVLASRDQAAANLENVRFSLDQAKAELNDAMLNFNRNKELIAKGFIARTEYDSSETRFRRAQAAVSGAEAAISAAAAALKATDAAVEYTYIRAPFDAVVLTKDADVGDIVTPLGAAANAKAAVVTIADMSSLQVEADVSESNLGKVKRGQPCEIQLDAIPDVRFRGSVHMIVPTADRSKASIMVKVRFLNNDPRILPEMSARVSFLERAVTKEEEQPVVTVNPGAVVTRNTGSVVYVVTGRTVREAAITTGEQLGDVIVVLEGLKAGDKVVVNPSKKLKTGMRISIKEG